MNRRFLRDSNVSRILGGIAIISGEFFAKGNFNLLGLEFPSNIIQVAGFISFFMPTIREIMHRVLPERNNNKN